MATGLVSVGMILSTVHQAYRSHKLSVKGSIVKSCFISIIGYVLRCMTRYSIFYLYAAQLAMGTANAYHLNVRLKLFQDWFAPENIKSALTYVSLIMLVGRGFLNIAPFFFVDEVTQTKEEQEYGLMVFYALIIIACALTMYLTILYYREIPPTGYGYAVNNTSTFRIWGIRHFLAEIAGLFDSSLFIKYLLLLTLANMGLNNLSDALNLALIGFGYKQTDGSWSLCYFYIWGLAGAVAYDRCFHHLNKTMLFLRLYTYCGFVNQHRASGAFINIHQVGELWRVSGGFHGLWLFPYEQFATGHLFDIQGHSS